MRGLDRFGDALAVSFRRRPARRPASVQQPVQTTAALVWRARELVLDAQHPGDPEARAAAVEAQQRYELARHVAGLD